MIKKITYENKVAIQNDENIARKNKVTDEDMNEIKEVVNCNAQDFEIAETDISNIKTEQITQNTKITNLETDNTTNKEDISNLKESVETLETDNTEKDKIISDLKEENQRLKEDLKGLPQGQASGESIDINDSAEMRMLEFEVGGNSRQESRSGKNQLKNIATTQTIRGITFTVNEDKSVTVNGTATETITFVLASSIKITEQMKLYGCPSTGANGRLVLQGVKGISSAGGSVLDIGAGVNIPADFETVTVRIMVYANMTINNEIFYPMLLKATETDLSYEPYGASPSPDYPSEVESCGDNVNLFDGEIESGNINSLGATYNDNTMIRSKSYTKVKPNTDIIIANNGIAIQANVVEYDKDYNFIVKTYVNADKITTNSQTNYIKFVCSPVDENKIKIESGSIPTPYSKYGQGNINVEIENYNNLFNKAKEIVIGKFLSSDGNIGTDTTLFYQNEYIEVKSNTTYIISAKNGENFRIVEYDGNKAFIRRNLNSGTTTTYIITTSTNCKFIRISTSITNVDSLIIQEGSTILNNKSQTYTIPVQKPLRKIGEYKDTFVKKNGKWYERHYIKRLIYTGSEIGISLVSEGFYLIYPDAKEKSQVKSNYFKNYITKADFKKNNYGMGFLYAGYKHLYIRDTDFDNVTSFKEWLSEQYNAGTPVYVDYVLEEPQDIECTPEQTEILDKIENEAKTYKGVTHIYSTDKVEPNMKVTYLKDIEMMIGG